MRRLVQLPAWVSLLLLIAGCANQHETTKSHDEPAVTYKSASELRNTEHFVVDYQIGIVSARVSEFRNKCLKEQGVAARMGSNHSGMISLLVREYDTGNAQGSASSAEDYVLVAEMRPIGTSKTRVDVYHASQGKIVDSLQDWMEGKRRSCPSF